MKSYHLLCTLFCLFFVPAQAQETVTLKGYTHNEDIAKGTKTKRKLAEIRMYYTKDSTLAQLEEFSLGDPEKLNQIRYYDTTGKQNKKFFYSDDSSFSYKVSFERDELGNLSKQTMEKDGNIYVLEHTNIYNEKKLLEKSYLYSKTTAYTQYFYDKNGNLISQQQYMNGQLQTGSTYVYDSLNRKISEESFDNKNGEQAKYIFKYNQNNELEKEETYLNNKFVSTNYYKWDKKLPKEVKIVYHLEFITQIVSYEKE